MLKRIMAMARANMSGLITIRFTFLLKEDGGFLLQEDGSKFLGE